MKLTLVRERMPGIRHGKDTPPLTIWEAPSSPHSSASMVKPRSRFLSWTYQHPMVIVTVNGFSKACRLVPLKGLPTSMETAEVLFNHVFRNVGIPVDIVSDRGPQFILRVWRSFFSLLGVTVSLSFVIPPTEQRSNGKKDPGDRALPPYLLPQPPELLEPIHCLGWVRTELPPPSLYGSHPLPVRTLLPATSVPLIWGTFKGTIS